MLSLNVGSPARVSPGKCSNNDCSPICSSMRASAAPKQACTPVPKLMSTGRWHGLCRSYRGFRRLPGRGSPRPREERSFDLSAPGIRGYQCVRWQPAPLVGQWCHSAKSPRLRWAILRDSRAVWPVAPGDERAPRRNYRKAAPCTPSITDCRTYLLRSTSATLESRARWRSPRISQRLRKGAGDESEGGRLPGGQGHDYRTA